MHDETSMKDIRDALSWWHRRFYIVLGLLGLVAAVLFAVGAAYTGGK
jgi:hypothetical protein